MSTPSGIRRAALPPAAVPSGIVTRVQAGSSWWDLGLGELWRYRELLWFLTMRDIKAHYRQMALGPIWILIQPVIDMVVMSLIFQRLAGIATDGAPGPLFLFTAILPWNYFSNSANSAVGSLTAAMPLISKVYFPRLAVPISVVISGLVDLAARMLVLTGLVVFFVARGSIEPPSAAGLLMLVPYTVLASATALAVGLWGATLAVRFRDLRFVVRTLTEIWKYGTPLVYPLSLIAERLPSLVPFFKMNPMFWVLAGYRTAVYGGGSEAVRPDGFFWASSACVVLLLFLGVMVFRKTERNIVDLL